MLRPIKFLVFLFILSPIFGSYTDRVVATVNNQPILKSQLEMRAKFLLFSMGAPINPQNLQQVAENALKTLEIDAVKTQFAGEEYVPGPLVVEQHYAHIAARNGQSLEALNQSFSQSNVDKQSLFDQIRANVGFENRILDTYGAQIHVGRTEVDKTIELLKQTKTDDFVLLAEVFLPFGHSRQDSLKQAEFLRGQIAKGSNLSQFSKQFPGLWASEMGWLPVKELEGPLRLQVAQAKEGTVLPPFATDTGLRIIVVQKKREAQKLAEKGTTLISYVTLECDVTKVGFDVEANLKEVLKQAKSAYLLRVGLEPFGKIRTQVRENVNLALLPGNMQSILSNVKEREISAPVYQRDRDGKITHLTLHMVVKRKELKPGEIDRDYAIELLRNRKLENFSQIKLQELYRDAIIRKNI